MLLTITFLGILSLILLIAYFKLDTFISFILVALAIGLATGMDIAALGIAIKKGIGDTLGELVLIVGFGAMLGKLVAESGAAQRITNALIALFGIKYIAWGLALAGFIIGIPLFYNAGFMVVVPLIFSVVMSTRLPLLYVAIPMCAALSVAHGYLPPHPSPSAIATALHADMNKTLLYGIIIAIPAIIIAGVLFGSTLKKYNPTPNKALFDFQEVPENRQPSLLISVFTALLPVFLLTVIPAFKVGMDKNTIFGKIVFLCAEPYIGMLISVLVALYFLGVKQGKTMQNLSKSLEDAFKNCSSILLIIAGASVLKQVLNDSGISLYIGEQLKDIPISPLVLGWLIAGVIRICIGSATIAGFTAVSILAKHFEHQTGVSPELMTLAIGAGSLMFSHLNDSGFWFFKQYFNISIKETLLTWTVTETLVSVVGLLGVLLLDLVI